MSDHASNLVQHWIAPPLRLPWAWDPTGEAVCWDGATVAMGAEITEIVGGLAPGGLPPFGALVLLLSACRDSWPAEGPGRIAVLQRLAYESSGSGAQPEHGPLLERVRARLDAVAALPRGQRATTVARLALAIQMRDRAGPDLAAADALVISAVMSIGLPRAMLRGKSEGSWRAQLQAVLSTLDRGLTEADPQQAELEQRTGLDVLPEPAGVDAATMRALVAGGLDDPELVGVATLARRLMAAVHLPRPLAEPDELQAGGVSDLSQRGSPDRLLVSELANDDLVLAVRIATGEALYLRRETPPRSPVAVRAILLDSGIRMWGLPRVFATAVALALAATAPPGTRTRAWRAAGDAVQPVDLGSRDGLVAHLAALSGEPQPGAALAAWRATLDDDGAEAVLITHPEAIADADFRTALANSGLNAPHAACVDAEGGYRLLAFDGILARELQSATLDLDGLLRPAAGRTTLRDGDEDAPLIHRVEPFPLLLAHPVDPERAADLGVRGVLSATTDGRLTLWERGRTGARQLADNLPHGVVRWIGADDDTAFVVHHRRKEQRWTLSSASLAGGAITIRDLGMPDEDPSWLGRQHDGLIVVWPGQARVFALATGEQVAVTAIQPYRQYVRKGRFLGFAGGWSAITWSGLALAWTDLYQSKGSVDHLDYVLFDRHTPLGETCAFMPTGEVFNVTDATRMTTGLPSSPRRYQLLRTSQDGHQLLVAGADDQRWRVDLLTGRSWQLKPTPNRKAGDRGVVLDIAIHDLSGCMAEAIHEPTRLWCADGNRLAIRARQGRVYYLSRSKTDFAWTQMPKAKVPTDATALVTDGIRDRHQRLVATANLSRFRCDARGLLYLDRPGAGELPELVIPLRRGAVPVWSSDGKRCGAASWWIDGKAGTDLDELARILAAYVLDLL